MKKTSSLNIRRIFVANSSPCVDGPLLTDKLGWVILDPWARFSKEPIMSRDCQLLTSGLIIDSHLFTLQRPTHFPLHQ